MAGKPRIHEKRDAVAPIVMPTSRPADPVIGVEHVYISGGLLVVVIATDLRFDMPDTLWCRFLTDEGATSPPRQAHRLTAELFEKIVADATRARDDAGTSEETRTAIERKLANLQEFIANRRNVGKHLPFTFDVASR